MINLTVRLDQPAATGTAATSGNSSSSNSSASSTSSQSFASELSEAISQALAQFGINPSTVQLTVDETGSQNSAASQNSVANSSSAAMSNTASTATPAQVTSNVASPVTSTALTPETASSATPTSATPASSASTAPQIPTSPVVGGSAADEAYDTAYWAEQPAAVQQLQNVQDLTQRTQLGEQLASEGYTIDVPIMVWGWDPATTMQQRAADGYTWVPSALQQPVTAAPGISGQGITPYEPNSAPAGSIPV